MGLGSGGDYVFLPYRPGLLTPQGATGTLPGGPGTSSTPPPSSGCSSLCGQVCCTPSVLHQPLVPFSNYVFASSAEDKAGLDRNAAHRARASFQITVSNDTFLNKVKH